MTYPIASSPLTIPLNTKRTYQTNLLQQRFNGGVDERSTGFSANPTEDSWSLDITINHLTNYSAIEAFLQERDGKPFRFDWDGNGVATNEVYWVENTGQGLPRRFLTYNYRGNRRVLRCKPD